MRDYDKALLGFRYGEALDLVLRNGDSILVKTLLTELKHRAALPQAVHNRNPETLLPILQWMQSNFNDPRYTGIIIDVMYEVLGMSLSLQALMTDNYGADLLEDQNVAYVVEGITRKVGGGVEQAKTSRTLIGMLEMIAN